MNFPAGKFQEIDGKQSFAQEKKLHLKFIDSLKNLEGQIEERINLDINFTIRNGFYSSAMQNMCQ